MWTSSTIASAVHDPSGNKWAVTVKRSDGTERAFNLVKHVVFATGLGAGDESIKLPIYLGIVCEIFPVDDYVA